MYLYASNYYYLTFQITKTHLCRCMLCGQAKQGGLHGHHVGSSLYSEGRGGHGCGQEALQSGQCQRQGQSGKSPSVHHS